MLWFILGVLVGGTVATVIFAACSVAKRQENIESHPDTAEGENNAKHV